MSNVATAPSFAGGAIGEKILRLPQVKDRSGLGRSSIYAGVKNGIFPAPVKLGERAVGWIASSIDEWVQSRALCGHHREAA